MAYIVKKKNREGKQYVYLVEGYREGDKVRQRTLKNYGSLEVLEKKEPGAFERLRQEAKAGLLGKKAEEELLIKLDLEAPIAPPDKSYGWKILDDLYNNLGIEAVLTPMVKKKRSSKKLHEILKLLVYQRILYPQSKSGTCRSQNALFGDWDISQNDVFRALPQLNELKEALQLTVHESVCKHTHRQATLVFYDVTNYYFETDLDDEDLLDETGSVLKEGLRRRGASKERRPKPIVQLGLFMDTNGIPISYRLFRGNQTDPITYLPAIEQVKKQFGLERIIVVADKAMNSKSNVSKTYEEGDGWLFSQKHRGRRGASKDIQEFILDPEGWEYNECLSFGKKSMIRKRKLGKDQEVTEKILVTWSKKYADREKIRRDGALDYAMKLTDAEVYRQTCKRGGKKYLSLHTLDKETGEKKAFSPFIHIDREEVAFDAQFDGVNVLVTSELGMDDEQMLEQYKELSRIEDCFRVTKSEFHSRPVYVWKKEHIEAHFLTCFLALVVLRLLQHKTSWKLSPKRMIDGLNSAKVNELEKGYYRVQGNEDFIALTKMLSIKWDKQYVKAENMKKFAKGWFTT